MRKTFLESITDEPEEEEQERLTSDTKLFIRFKSSDEKYWRTVQKIFFDNNILWYYHGNNFRTWQGHSITLNWINSKNVKHDGILTGEPDYNKRDDYKMYTPVEFIKQYSNIPIKSIKESITDEPEEEEQDDFTISVYNGDIKIYSKKYNISVTWQYVIEDSKIYVTDTNIDSGYKGINSTLDNVNGFYTTAKKIIKEIERKVGNKFSDHIGATLSIKIKEVINDVHKYGVHEMITPSIQLGGNMTPASPDSFIMQKERKKKKGKVGIEKVKLFKNHIKESITEEPEEEEEPKNNFKIGSRVVLLGGDIKSAGTVFWIDPKNWRKEKNVERLSLVGVCFDENMGGHNLFMRYLCPIKCPMGHGLFAYTGDLKVIQGTGTVKPQKATKKECIRWLDYFIDTWGRTENNEEKRERLIDIYDKFLDIYKFPKISADELFDSLVGEKEEE